MGAKRGSGPENQLGPSRGGFLLISSIYGGIYSFKCFFFFFKNISSITDENPKAQ